MLNITSQQRHANQNRNGIAPHTRKDGYNKKKNKKTRKISVGKDVEKLEPWCIVGRNTKLHFAHSKL